MAEITDVVIYRRRGLSSGGIAYGVAGLLFILIHLIYAMLNETRDIAALAWTARIGDMSLGEFLLDHGPLALLFFGFSMAHFHCDAPARNYLRLDPDALTFAWRGETHPLLWREVSAFTLVPGSRPLRIEFATSRQGLMMRSAPWFKEASRHGATGKIEDGYDRPLPEIAATLNAFCARASSRSAARPDKD